MTNLRIKIDAGYGTTIAETEDQLLCARVLTMIHEIEAGQKEARTPEQVAVDALREEMGELRDQLNSERWRREEAEKKLKEATGTPADSSSTF